MSTIAARNPQPSTPTGPDGSGESRAARPATPPNGERPVEERPSRRRRAINPSSAQALAMLTRQPIFAAPVPRIHVGPRAADGSVLVDDRISDRKFRVYTPRHESQFRAGYRAGLWYVRTPGDAEASPRSPGFPDAAAAIDALRTPPPAVESPRPRCRVIWS